MTPKNISWLRDREVKYLLLLVAIVFIRFCLMPLGSSLSLDETGTYWVIQGNFQETLSRIAAWPGQPALFCIVEWGVKQVGGAREVVLRLPSVLAMGGTVVLLFRLGERLFDRLTALIAILVFLCMRPVAYAATDARPYALALLTSIAAMLFLLEWFDRRRSAHGIAYAVFASLTIYLQPVFGVLFLVHAGYALYKLRQGSVSWRELIGLGGLVLLLLIPAIPGFLALGRIAKNFTHVPKPQLIEFLNALALPSVCFAMIAGLFPFFGRDVLRFRPVLRNREDLFFLASWAVVPVLLFFVTSLFLPTKLFAARYMVSSAPALALLFAWAIRAFEPVQLRRLILLILAVTSIGLYGVVTRLWPNHDGNNWRAAMQAVRTAAGGKPGTLVLMQSGFIESNNPLQFFDPASRDMLLAPTVYYPIEADVLPFPDHVNAENLKYLSQLSSSTLEPRGRFLFVTCESGNGLLEGFTGRLDERGFKSTNIADFGEINLTMFERR